jgi:hypothetical protein
MDPNACPVCGGWLFANRTCRCGWPKSESLKRDASPPSSLLTGHKRCRHCGGEKPLGFFPRDRSRPDGRWHTCTMCNKKRWAEQGKQRALRKLEERIRRRENSRSGIQALRKHYRNGSAFDSLPPVLRRGAEMIWSNSLARAKAEGRHLSQPEIALRKANAVSNCVRVGDSSWSRSMLRHKGYRRAEREQKRSELHQPLECGSLARRVRSKVLGV